MIPSELSKLKSLAEAATPGEWKAYDWPSFPTPRRDEYDSCVRIESENTITAFCFDGKPNHDALWIAAANPQVILELIGQIEAAVEVIKFYSTSDTYLEGNVRTSIWDSGSKARQFISTIEPKEGG